MFLRVIGKLRYTPVNASFTVKKLGVRESKLYMRVFVLSNTSSNQRGKRAIAVRVIEV